MTGRSTSWFDRDELKALFKGVRPARAPEPASGLGEVVVTSALPAPSAKIVSELPPAPPPPVIATPNKALETPDKANAFLIGRLSTAR